MKKLFVEPNMRRIELNLSENIAESGSDMYGLHFLSNYLVCTVQTTGKTMENVTVFEAVSKGCVSGIDDAPKGGTTVPLEKVRMYMKRQ